MDNTDPTRPTPPPAPAALAPVAASPAALVVPGGWQIEGLPDIVLRAGPQAAERTVEFFTAQIRNPHTRAAYGTAVTRFFTWCDARGLELEQISPIAVATYIDEMQGQYRAPTIKQHLAAIRRLFDWLVIGQVVPANPAASVRGPTHVVRTGKTPVLQPAEARLLLDTIDTSTLPGLRDRALLGVMVYSFARVSAIVGMRVEDYYQQGKRWWLRLQEKGGKAPRRAGPPQGGGLSRRLSRRGRDRGRERRAPVALDAAGGRDGRAPDEPGGCVPDDQATRQNRRARRGQLPHLPGHGHHGLSAQWRHARARPERSPRMRARARPNSTTGRPTR